jgi:hypothetical protein
VETCRGFLRLGGVWCGEDVDDDGGDGEGEDAECARVEPVHGFVAKLSCYRSGAAPRLLPSLFL